MLLFSESALLFILRDGTLQIDNLFLGIRGEVVLAGNKMNNLLVLTK